MIKYTEMGMGLHNAIAAAGYTLEHIDGEWVSSDDIAVQSIIDSYFETHRDTIIEAIKSHAQALIYKRYPQWRQANMTARALELSMSVHRSADDDAELSQIRAAWDWIRDVRIASAVHESGVIALATAHDLASYHWRDGWPE